MVGFGKPLLIALGFLVGGGVLHDLAAAEPPVIPDAVEAFAAKIIKQKQKQVETQGYDVAIRARINLENFNDDNLDDVVLVYGDPYHCGSGGCVIEFYRNEGGDQWAKVYEYQGSDFYHLSTEKIEGQRDIVHLSYVSRDNVSSVARWQGDHYELDRYVTAQHFFYPTEITYWSKGPKKILDYPFSDAEPIYVHDPRQILMPLATTRDGRWHMMLLSPSAVGFFDDAGLKAAD